MILTGYDLRGIFKKDLTLDIIYDVVGEFFKKLNIKDALLAVDTNKNNWFIKDFLKKNFSFQFLGILPTPIFYYEVIKRKKPGVMITASHLPLKYSGLKFILSNGEPWKPKSAYLVKRRRIKNDKYYLNQPTLTNIRIDQFKNLNLSLYNNYFSYLRKIIKPKKKIYVNFDKKNFFLNFSLPFFQKLKIYHRNNSFIKIKSDLDNDRIFIFIKNKKIHNDLVFYYLAKFGPYQKLGVPFFFSQKLKNELLKIGKKIFFIKTGHYFFKKAYKKHNLDLAFEPSGHFYMFKDIKTESPYLSLGLFLFLIADKNFNDLLKLNSFLQLYRFNFKKKKNIAQIVFWLQKKFSLKLRKFDGYLLFNQNFYLHLRQSKTEDKIRVSYEGSRKYLKEIKKWLMNI